MQDNKDIANIDEQFTDLGWEKMQGLLNKEMPVAPMRKPRWSWLWLLLFFGIMASGTYYNFVIKNGAVKPNEVSNITDAEIVNVIENTSDTTTLEENDEASTKTIISDKKQPSDTDIQSKEKTIISPKNITKTTTEKNTLQKNLHIKKENNFIDRKPRTDDFSRRVDDLTAEVVSTDIPVISEKEPTKIVKSSIVTPTKIPSRNSSINTKRIPTLSPQITRNNIALQALPEVVPVPKIRKFSHTYSTFAGVRSDEFTNFGSANAGVLAHYRFTPKVGLETGLAYGNFRKNINTNVDYTDEVNLEYPSNTEQFSTTFTDALNLHYLRLPLSFTYRPHRKIQLATGLNVGYRLPAFNNTANSSDESNLNSSDTQITDDTYSSSFEVDVTSVGISEGSDPGELIAVSYSFSVHKWDLAAHAGLRYYPIPRLGIDLSYQYGLLNVTNNNTVNRNSGLQLALVWQLHR